MADWVRAYFDDVDTRDVDAFLRWLSDDVTVHWANTELVGKAAVGETISGFYGAIDGMKHDLHSEFEHDGENFTEATVKYTRKDGQEVTVRAMTVLKRPADLIEELRVYLDTAPVFAA